MVLNDYSKNKNSLDNKVELCEYVGCKRDANMEIAIYAGDLETLILDLCSNCIDKFMKKQVIED